MKLLIDVQAGVPDDGRVRWGLTVGRISLAFVWVLSVWGQPAVLTWHNDNARSGQIINETLLQPANVNSSTFGKLFTIPVDGHVDAQPLYVPAVNIGGALHNVLVVATESDSVYAFDADTGAVLWHASLLLPGETTSEPVYGCGQVSPQIGVTSTPVIDPGAGPNGAVYVVAMSKDSNGNYFQRLHALDLVTKAELFGGPVAIQATYPGSGDNSSGGKVVFEPKAYKDRAGLLLLNGIVYTSWASHCDIRPYTAWVIGYDRLTLQQVNVIDLTPNGSEGSIWGSGAGPAADAGGNVYLLMANGAFDTTLNASGFPNQGNYGNAFVKLSSAGRTLTVADYFAMDNDISEDDGDVDLGSGGAMLLPPLTDSQKRSRNLAVGAGKDGNLYVVDTGNMGKFSPSSNQVYQELTGALPGGIWSAPAWFNGSVYYGSVGSHIQAFPFANGLFTANPATTGTSFGYPGATPSVSANGSNYGIVWASENTNPAALHAYRADDLSTELYNSNQATGSRDHFGAGNKFITPTVANGKVYVGTTNGVGVFGLLHCSYSIDQHALSFLQAGGTASVNVTTSSACVWSVSTDASFVTINGSIGATGSASVSFNVGANGTGSTRIAHLTIAGQTLTVSQGTAGVSYTLTTAVVPAGSGMVTASPGASGLTYPSGTRVCLTATPASDWMFTSWSGATLDAQNCLVMNANTTVSARFTCVAGCLLLDQEDLWFGATSRGAIVTGPQVVHVTASAGVSWSASSNKSYMVVSPTSGTGNGTFTVAIQSTILSSPATLSGTVTVTAGGVTNSPQTVQVSLNVINSGSTAAPFGSFDTPANNTTGITGSIAVTGWALDDVEVQKVQIWRDPLPSDGATGLIYIGDATFVPGARPDVQAAYPGYPLNNRAGWGYLMLTNGLPSSGGSAGTGNGTYRVHAIAIDLDGHTAELGAKTITCDNADAATPFGAIDTPAQGATVSGTIVNFGWTLTPQPASISVDGSTIWVTVDGQNVGHPVYNQYRSDIATGFPGYANANGAVGYFYLDTTTLSNGMHTIGWLVTDNHGRADGVGSRFFWVQN